MVPPHANFECDFLGQFLIKFDTFFSWQLAITPNLGMQSQKFEYSLNLVHSKSKCEKVLFQEGLNIKLIFSDGFYDVVTAFGSTKLRPVIVKTPPSSPAKDSTGSNQIQTYEETNDDVPIMGET